MHKKDAEETTEKDRALTGNRRHLTVVYSLFEADSLCGVGRADLCEGFIHHPGDRVPGEDNIVLAHGGRHQSQQFWLVNEVVAIDVIDLEGHYDCVLYVRIQSINKQIFIQTNRQPTNNQSSNNSIESQVKSVIKNQFPNMNKYRYRSMKGYTYEHEDGTYI